MFESPYFKHQRDTSLKIPESGDGVHTSYEKIFVISENVFNTFFVDLRFSKLDVMFRSWKTCESGQGIREMWFDIYRYLLREFETEKKTT